MTLSIGLQLASLLKKKGYTVCLTRSTDVLLELNARTHLANNFLAKNSGDAIFVSIHANSSRNNSVVGIETFCMQNSLFVQGDFFCQGANISQYVNYISMYLKNKDKKSRVLASNLHKNMYSFIKSVYPEVRDRKLKHSVSQVLIGAHMPAVLVEVGFLSNKDEAQFLESKKNHGCIAKGICKGIIEYFKRA